MLALGILGDAFGKLFGLIWDAFKWLGAFFKSLFQKLVDIIIAFFMSIYYIIDGLLYFLFMIGVVAVKVFGIFFELGKLIIALFVGFGKTLASLTYVTSSSGGHGYSSIMGQLINIANTHLQLNVIAYILLFSIWFIWVVSAMKLLSSIRVGGD